MIQKIKYHRAIGLTEYFIPALSDFVSQWFQNVNLIIPVPLGKNREHQRGYNQAGILAKPIARRLSIPFSNSALERIRETESQVGLSAEKRKINIQGAFRAREKFVKGKVILVLDDISTTGSTLNECAKALKKAGALKVFCFTFAKAVL